MKVVLVSVAIFISGCSTQSPVWKQVAGNALGNASGQTISYNGSRCVSIRQSCPAHLYSEWQQAHGELACSCDNDRD
ncbi:hypothetical protein HMF8227_02226 [Saliniradius amylolyticus]|uniref:Lipoprotein n=1 Tax=Saliniradius amylolyticus TaxID=2183582 RepID=A0A2S2E505_9ALTE|nr:hypothetical protein [Saliniradius amylolyticus]AWL12679.1 hypothetical protein HMF8227_02226 [Saliniradius amylolyticus]